MTTELTLLYGAVEESELLFKDLLVAKMREFPNFKVIFYLNNVRGQRSMVCVCAAHVRALTAPEPGPVCVRERAALCALSQPPPGWTGGVGFITESVIRQYMPPPGAGVKLVLCGPPGMCKALKPVILGSCGYTPEEFFSFM